MSIAYNSNAEFAGACSRMGSHSPVFDCVYNAKCQAFEELGGRDSLAFALRKSMTRELLMREILVREIYEVYERMCREGKHSLFLHLTPIEHSR